MYILAIETTGPLGSVALIDEDGKWEAAVSAEEMNHLKDLMPMADKLLSEAGIKKTALSAVAASIGPGSFTGIRIGVSSARALAQALQIPAISVPTLELFKLYCEKGKVIVPIFNARRGQVYGGIFDENKRDILKSGPYMLTDIFDAIKGFLASHPEEKSGEILFYGDGIDAYEGQLLEFKEELKPWNQWSLLMTPKEKRYQSAELVVRAALAKYLAGDTLEYSKLLPDYMRLTEAEQKLKDGSLAREREAKMARFKAR